MRDPITAAVSRASRPCGESRCTRERTASCTVGGRCCPARCHHLGHKERVATGLTEQRVGIDACLGRELRDRRR